MLITFRLTPLAVLLTALAINGSARGAPIAGVDFDDGAGGFDATPDDLDPGDMITVSNWTFANGAGISNDGNAQTGRASAPVGKFNGENNLAQPPAGGAPPTGGAANLHSFSITIPAGVAIDLEEVSFDFSRATGSGQQRWLAFKTSLDSDLLFSEIGPPRPALESAVVDLSGSQYQGLTDQTIDFQWFAGGPGTGDIDIDSILINASPTLVPEPTSIAIWSLIGVGLIGFGYGRYRCSKK